MSNAFAPILRARPCPIFGRPVHPGSPPIDYSPILLLKPFGFRITPDTLSSSEISRWPARHYPRLWIQRPSSERRRDFNPPNSCAAQRTIRTHPPPSRLRPISRVRRLYGLPCSGDFAPGRGGLLQLLSMSLSPCCRFHPAKVNNRVSQSSVVHAAFAFQLEARPLVAFTFEATMRSLLLRPGDS